jgi:hypothetical protein
MQPESDPDGQWVSELTGQAPEVAQKALSEAQAERSLFRYLARQHAAEGRDSYIEIDAPLELHALVRLLRPRHVVEVGVSSGVSSAYLLDALEKNGSGLLHSIDLPSFERPAGRGRRRTRFSWSLPPGRLPGWAVPPRLRSRWDLRVGDKATVLPFLAEQLPTIDLFVYDVPHECSATWRELQALASRFGTGAVVIIDHGPGGGLCPALASCAWTWRSEPVRRQGLGLYATHRPAA